MQTLNTFLAEAKSIVVLASGLDKFAITSSTTNADLVKLKDLVAKTIIRPDTGETSVARKKFLKDVEEWVQEIDGKVGEDYKWMHRELQEFLRDMKGSKAAEQSEWMYNFIAERTTLKPGHLTAILNKGGGPGGQSYFDYVGKIDGEPIAFSVANRAGFNGPDQIKKAIELLTHLSSATRSKLVKAVSSVHAQFCEDMKDSAKLKANDKDGYWIMGVVKV